MARFCSLFSSSSGNCTYIGTSSANILIDVGVSAKRTDEALRGIGVDPDDIDAIFITHEHSDHINGVRVFASKHNIKVYATPGTLTAMEKAGALSEKNVYEPVNPAGTEVNVYDFKDCGHGFTYYPGAGTSFALDTACAFISSRI